MVFHYILGSLQGNIWKLHFRVDEYEGDMPINAVLDLQIFVFIFCDYWKSEIRFIPPNSVIFSRIRFNSFTLLPRYYEICDRDSSKISTTTVWDVDVILNTSVILSYFSYFGNDLGVSFTLTSDWRGNLCWVLFLTQKKWFIG